MSLETIPGTAFEVVGDKVTVQQRMASGEVSLLTLHRVHVQHFAGLLSLLQGPSPQEAELQRRLLNLHERIEHLADYLALHSDHRHADLQYETDYARATCDVADAFIADLSIVAEKPC